MQKINELRAGISGAIVIFILMVISTLLAFIQIGNPLFVMLGFLQAVYINFNDVLVGNIINVSWGIIDGFMGCAVLAFAYNRVCACSCVQQGLRKTRAQGDVGGASSG